MRNTFGSLKNKTSLLLKATKEFFSKLSQRDRETNLVLSARTKTLVVLAISILVQTVAHAEATKTAKLLSIYEISLGKHENFIVSNSANFQTGILTSKIGKTLIVAKEYVPQSINSVKIRALEDGAPVTAVRILSGINKSIFVYETPEQFHVYSTLGGHLLISKKVQPKFDFSKLSLVKKPINKVMRL
jgi:hypothetical protein